MNETEIIEKTVIQLNENFNKTIFIFVCYYIILLFTCLFDK